MGAFVPKVQYRKWTVDVSQGSQKILLPCHDFRGLLASESHYRKPNGSWSGGGPFYAIRRSLIHQQGEVSKVFRGNGVSQTCSSAGAVGTPSFAVPVISKSSIENAFAVAAGFALEGYNRTRPGMPEADLWVGLKELITDGFPSIPLNSFVHGSPKGLVHWLDSTIRGFRNLGSEYLNVVFGWRPFVNDLRKLYNLMWDIDRRVKQLAAQNGHLIRRRATLRSDVQTSFETQSYNYAYGSIYGGSGLPNSFGGGRSFWTRVTTTTDNVWYSARYRYWIPDTTSWLWRARAAAVLFGGLPTPGALYAAMPWSWLADWFSSLGAIAQAISPSAVDNLVQLYGYTMRHQTTRVECTSYTSYPPANTEINLGGNTWIGYRFSGADLSLHSVYTDESKIRTGGFHPFGPDKTADGFSAYQIGVLSSLGLTRLG